MAKSKLLIFIFSIFLSVSITVQASVLGTTLIDGYTTDIGKGVDLTHNTWYSDQGGVGQQTENYVTYSPSSMVEPILTGGYKLFGKSTANTEIARLRSIGINPIAGINADFFSFQTGIPMSNIISDGVIVTKDGTKQYAVGITNDNKAFMGQFTLYSILEKEDGTSANIYNINKYRQPYAIYMFTDRFSTETHNNTEGFDVLLGDIAGEMKLGEKITATVESVDEYAGSVAIPEGKIILSVDKNAPAEFVEPIQSLQIGEKITISFGIEGDERFKKAKIAIGATGGMLLENGNISSNLEAGANPRTALGIKNDGSIILYTIDGRQSGYSYGAQLKTLASRLKELGCVDAINLDGGGSTTFTAQLPGNSIMTMLNKPSEGSQRTVANFIFLKNNEKATGVLNKLTIYPLTSYILKGATTTFSCKGSDTNYYPVNVGNVSYSVESGKASVIDSSGNFTAKDSGAVKIVATSGSVTGTTYITCVENPTEIRVIGEASNEVIKSLGIKRNATPGLTAEAYAGYNKLIATDDCFQWSCDEQIGKIDNMGNFTANNVIAVSGNIYVKVGSKSVTIPVTINANGEETEEELKSKVDLSVDNDIANVNISSNFGLTVDKSNIIIKADNKKIDFDYSENKAVASLPKGTKKVTVYVTNSYGKVTFKTITLNEKSATNPFLDTTDHWAKDLLSYLYDIKVINGERVSQGLKFNPNKSMTRSEFAVMVANYLGLNVNDYADVSLPYNDLDSIPNWALGSFKALYSLDILKGASASDGIYANPTNNITRAETATIIARTLPSNVTVGQINAGDKGEIADWAKEGIGKLVELGAIGGYEDGTIKPLRNVTKAEASKILYSIM